MSGPTSNIKIDGDRLWDSLEQIAKIGPGVAGGNNRQTLTDEDAAARALFREWCVLAGCAIGLDQMGNMFAMRPGTCPDALPVYVGSHLDTQPTGGKYDGVLGVLAGLEVVHTLNDLGIQTKHPIVVANWTNEEGSRFSPSMLGSGVFAGIYECDWAYARTDAKNIAFGDELERIGWKGEEIAGERKMHAYYELHIEQGPILEDEGKEIGVVTHGQGLEWLKVCVTGVESHAGSTPMPMRKNAGLGAARLVELVDQIAWSHSPNAVGTVGRMETFPNSPNVIPGSSVFTIDFRTPSLDVLKNMVSSFEAKGAQICAELGLQFSVETIGRFDPVKFDGACVDIVRAAASQLGYSHRDLISGAGHDACWISHVAPAAMVMCPCVGGISHNEAEEITPQWAISGTNVLLHAVMQSAECISVNPKLDGADGI